jgi:hypothetical protein
MLYTISMFGELLELIDDPTNLPGRRPNGAPNGGSTGGWGSLIAVPLMLLTMNGFCFMLVYGTMFAQYFGL